ncbi:Dual specificity mitogen-activated protein kinase kinase 2 [Armadillidium vulgare]|nr:Dual specificity mitogen-activated protein kinase kinase 2 [Armadillidium vulgare]
MPRYAKITKLYITSPIKKNIGRFHITTLTALNYLKEKLKLIHRDVKPSNILLDRRGNIKLCDFGISGHLVDSIAKTRDAGCRPYMAPERIDPAQARGYDVRSDVWSLGITLMELATGSFPYPKWNSVFEQLTQVVQGEPPRLNLTENGNTFTEDFVNFVNTWEVFQYSPVASKKCSKSELLSTATDNSITPLSKEILKKVRCVKLHILMSLLVLVFSSCLSQHREVTLTRLRIVAPNVESHPSITTSQCTLTTDLRKKIY